MSRFRELGELTRVRTVLFLREPEALFWVFAFPIILAAVLGFAFRQTELKESVIGLLPGGQGEEWTARLEAVARLEVQIYSDPERAALDLRNGKIDLLLSPGETPDSPDVRLDPRREEAELARLRVLRALNLAEAGDEARVPQLQVDPVTDAGSRYIDFLFPGLLGLNLMSTGLWSIGFSVADMRQRKVLKRLLVTPMRRSSFLLSFLTSRLSFFLFEIVFLLGFGVWILGVPFRTSVVSFLVITVLAAMAFAGLGLLCASRVRTIEGISGLLNFVMMPMWLGSGVFFSYERLPEVAQPFLKLLPLTALNDALRAMMLEGEPLAAVAGQLVVLVAWGVLPFLAALKLFRWE